MSKELEALERTKQMYEYFVKKYRDLEPKLMICEKEDFDIIKTALKDYERRLKLAKEYKDPDNVAKRLLALEIIKEYIGVNCLIEILLGSDCPKEKINLLKEVLK